MVIKTLLIALFFTEFAITILAYVITFIKFITCHKKHDCKNELCPIRTYCNKTAQSDREKAEIRRLRSMLQNLSNS